MLRLAALSACATAFVSVQPPQSSCHNAVGGRSGDPAAGRRRPLAASLEEDLEELTVAPASMESLPELSQAEVRRYSRHLILPDVGVEGQRRLKHAKVMCVGAGGLGSPAMLYLAAAGVGTIGVVDDDVVDESNLQRQVIHGESTLGVSKVISAADRVRDMNPHCTVKAVQAKLTSANALDVLAGYDVVLDGSDNFPTKYLVNDACQLLSTPCVYGAILGFEGQASVFSYRGGPNYRDLMPQPPPPGEVPSCAEGGVLGILPGVIGCIQATEVIKIILGKGDVLSGRVLLYDALKMRFREVELKKREDSREITTLIDYEGFCGFSAKPELSNTQPQAVLEAGEASTGSAEGPETLEQPPPAAQTPQFERVSVQKAWERLQDGWAPFVLDVRLPQEAAIASLPFADMLCPHREVSRVAEQLPRDADILVLCKAGARSARACEALAKQGFDRLYSLDGGIVAWAREVDPSLAVY